ncbi:MAG: hypothetical protein ACE5GK_00010 [Nitrospiria bacterium]
MIDSRPPLADELFMDNRIVARVLSRYPGSHPIIPYLRKPLPQESIEALLEKLQAEGDSDPERKRQITAVRYYLQDVTHSFQNEWIAQMERLGGESNYVTLLDQLRRVRQASKDLEPVLLVTFNYDQMLERALASVDIVIKSLGDYVNSDSFKLFKLHGSVGWVREVEIEGDPRRDKVSDRDNLAVAGYIILQSDALKFTNHFHIGYSPPPGIAPGRYLFPAIAIPVEKKSDFECPPALIDQLTQHLGQVTSILVVGWKASEQHFIKMMKEHIKSKVSICIVNGKKKEGEDVYDHLRSAGLPLHDRSVPEIYGGVDENRVCILNHGFTEFVQSRKAESVLYPQSQR